MGGSVTIDNLVYVMALQAPRTKYNKMRLVLKLIFLTINEFF